MLDLILLKRTFLTHSLLFFIFIYCFFVINIIKVVRRQLREQGVREENLERLTKEIIQAHQEERTSLHRTHYGSGVKVHDRMEGFTPLVAPEITKEEFRKIGTY